MHGLCATLATAAIETHMSGYKCLLQKWLIVVLLRRRKTSCTKVSRTEWRPVGCAALRPQVMVPPSSLATRLDDLTDTKAVARRWSSKPWTCYANSSRRAGQLHARDKAAAGTMRVTSTIFQTCRPVQQQDGDAGCCRCSACRERRAYGYGVRRCSVPPSTACAGPGPEPWSPRGYLLP